MFGYFQKDVEKRFEKMYKCDEHITNVAVIFPILFFYMKVEFINVNEDLLFFFDSKSVFIHLSVNNDSCSKRFMEVDDCEDNPRWISRTEICIMLKSPFYVLQDDIFPSLLLTMEY